MKGYIYILHFERPINEAGTCLHYVGCTCKPLERMVCHAKGHGARLTQVALEKGIGWRLASLWTCPAGRMRRIERLVKNWHGAAEHCGICSDVPRVAEGALSLPVGDMFRKVTSEWFAQVETTLF